MSEFEARKGIARDMVVQFLSTLSPPRGVDESRLSEIITQISDAFARRMPIKGNFHEAVGAVLTKLRDTHMSNTWPPQAAFVLAMPAREVTGPKAQETYKPKDQVEWLRDRMTEGHLVPEAMIWGVLSRQMPGQLLERYRSASVNAWCDTYSVQARGLMVSKYGREVEMYFPQEAAE